MDEVTQDIVQSETEQQDVVQDDVFDLDKEIDDFMGDEDDFFDDDSDDNSDDVLGVEESQDTEIPSYKLSDGTELQETEITGMISALTEFAQGNIPDEILGNVPEIRMLRDLASQNGMDSIQYLMSIAQETRATQEQALAQEFIEQGIEPQMALRYARIELQNREFQTREQQNYQRQQEEQRQHQERVRGWEVLQEKYPEFSEKYTEFEDFPQEMVKGLEDGLSPIEAYQNFLIGEQKRQTKQNMLQTKNRQRTVGSVRGVGNNIDNDAFLQGFM
jgi:hypothetical protein|nr:MAG TPA: hypothetical protein [Caudoviricetes sp.]